jgi:hypothetical protein
MIKNFYTKVVFAYPKTILLALFILLAFLAYNSTKLQIDASSNTLLLEGDKDLAFSREIAKRYEGPNFLIIAYTPKTPLLSKQTIQTLVSLESELLNLAQVKSVTALHNVPLLTSQNASLTDLANGVETLQDKKEFDAKAVKEEFLTNPLYDKGLVSDDFKTTAVMVKLHDDLKHRALVEKIEALRNEGANQEAIQAVEKELKAHRDFEREQNSQTIAQIRAILQPYKDGGELFLGGVNMISEDIITFIKNDLKLYGSLLTLLFVGILWVVFKRWQWVAMPIAVCLTAVVAATGTFGFFGREVTVLSSNFISLQLIITISLILHLIVRYRELESKYVHASQKKLVLNTVLSKFNPSFFATITTVAGFSSLIFSEIKPVIDLGVMMSIAILLSLLIVFLLFPVTMVLSSRITSRQTNGARSAAMEKVSYVSKHYPKSIFAAVVIVSVFSVSGASKLIVENSFIDYFKSTTEIYKGMKIIDEKLGGTTPLDVIIDFKSEETVQDDFADEFGFGDEFAQSENDPKYWFSQDKLQTILAVQKYLQSIEALGDIQSLATLLKVGQALNEGKELDSFQLALMYENIPQEYIDTVLSPYLDIEQNQIRFAIRVIDTHEGLRRDALLKQIKEGIEGLNLENVEQVRLTNLMVMYNNMLQSLFNSQILTLGVVALILYVMFFALFRSFAISLIALVTNLVPISMIFGIMGWLGIPLDMMTITIAAISIGIGVDDTIHYIDRFKSEYAHTKSYEDAVTKAHKSVGYAMSYTTLTVIVGFAILVFSNFLPTIYFGLLTVLVMALLLSSALLFLPRMLLTFRPRV